MLVLSELQKEFRAKSSTFIFILLSTVTCSFYNLHWLMCMVKKFSSEEDRTKTENWIICLAALQFLIIEQIITPIYSDTYGAEHRIAAIFLLVALSLELALRIFINCTIFQLIQNVSSEIDQKIFPKKIWSILFGELYYYYLIRNANSESNSATSKQDDKISTLEKLAKLRDSGIITEEEFTAQKQEILKK